VQDEHYAFILVADEKYWNRLRQRQQTGKETHVFVRKNLVGPTEARKLLFYVKKQKQIRGVADFVERLTGDHEELWKKFGAESFFESFDEYQTFAEGRKKMTFIRFNNFTELANPQPKETLTSVLGSLVWFRPKYADQKITELLTAEV